jgi:hypothetical protein
MSLWSAGITGVSHHTWFISHSFWGWEIQNEGSAAWFIDGTFLLSSDGGRIR